MRRVLHCLLIGFLTFSMSVDTARACWHRRAARACRPVACVVPTYAMAASTTCPPIHVGSCCVGAETSHGWQVAGGCCEAALGVAVVSEEIGCGRPAECCSGAGETLVVESVVAETAGPQEIAAATTAPAANAPASVVAAAAEPAPITIPPQTLADKPEVEKPDVEKTVASTPVPDLKSVEPVAAIEPAAAAAPKSTPQPTPQPTPEPADPVEPTAPPPSPKADAEPTPPAPAPVPASEPAPAPSKPKEENIFEEVENASRDTTEKPADKSEQPDAGLPPAATAPAAPTIEPPVVPAPTPGAGDAPAPLDAAAPAPLEPAPAAATENGPVPAAAAEEKPAGDDKPSQPAEEVKPAEDSKPADEIKPADEPKPAADADNALQEPLRRWIDATGTFATVGSFLELRGDGVEIRKANGRRILVPLGRLSAHDRTYVEEAAARLAARKASGPNASETAGL